MAHLPSSVVLRAVLLRRCGLCFLQVDVESNQLLLESTPLLCLLCQTLLGSLTKSQTRISTAQSSRTEQNRTARQASAKKNTSVVLLCSTVLRPQNSACVCFKMSACLGYFGPDQELLFCCTQLCFEATQLLCQSPYLLLHVLPATDQIPAIPDLLLCHDLRCARRWCAQLLCLYTSYPPRDNPYTVHVIPPYTAAVAV